MSSFSTRGRIFVAGHGGLVGSALVRRLAAEGADDLILRSRADLDLIDSEAVDAFFRIEKPDYVFLSAAKVGGILANSSSPAEFIHENLAIQTNVIHSAWKHGVQKFVFLGSSCIYPRDCPQPIREEFLLTGPLEPTNQWYAIAKIAGIKMCQAYRKQYGFDAICAMPTNLYGPGDNYELETSHVLPALIRKLHDASVDNVDKVAIWGSGTPMREFLHVDDLAGALIFMMRNYSDESPLNIGSGKDISVIDLARMIASVVGFKGAIETDPSRPDGTPRKLLDTTRLSQLGWRAEIPLREGIRHTYNEWLATMGAGR